MLDVHDDDPYLDEYRDRLEAGNPGPLDRANTAYDNAVQAADILSESDAADAARFASENVLRMAQLAARLIDEDRENEALAVAYAAEIAAKEIANLDEARFDGLARFAPFNEGTGGSKRAARLA